MGGDVVIGIVEDDAEVRGAYEDLMRSYGLQALSYESAESFLADQAELRINCLILDQGLPGMNGLELQQVLHEQGSRIPVLFVTSDERASVKNAALANGARGFVSKPVTAEQLMRMVVKMIS